MLITGTGGLLSQPVPVMLILLHVPESLRAAESEQAILYCTLLLPVSVMVLPFVFVGLFFGAVCCAVRVFGRRVDGEEF